MTEQTRLALEVLRKIQSINALRDIVLIGSWCKIIYIKYFDTEEISVLRTSDIDLLIPQNPKIKNDVDIGKIFEELGFSINHEQSGLIKYDHEELEIQFLTNEKGRGKNPPVYDIKPYHIKAEGLRYVEILMDNAFDFDYEDIKVRLPLPEAFILQKILISDKRKDEKVEKDLTSVEELSELCLQDPDRIKGMGKIFSNMPLSWQKKITKIVENKQLPIMAKMMQILQ